MRELPADIERVKRFLDDRNMRQKDRRPLSDAFWDALHHVLTVAQAAAVKRWFEVNEKVRIGKSAVGRVERITL